MALLAAALVDQWPLEDLSIGLLREICDGRIRRSKLLKALDLHQRQSRLCQSSPWEGSIRSVAPKQLQLVLVQSHVLKVLLSLLFLHLSLKRGLVVHEELLLSQVEFRIAPLRGPAVFVGR